MRLATTALVIALGFVMLSTSHAASTARCTEDTVEEDAYVTFDSPDYVDAYSNPEDMVCSFVVNSASQSARGTPRGAQLWATVMDQLADADVEILVHELTLARENYHGDISDYRASVSNLLTPESPGLDNCFYALANYGQPIQEDFRQPVFVEDDHQYFVSTENDELQAHCLVTPPDESEYYITDTPALFLFVHSEQGMDSLLLPKGAIPIERQ